MRVQRGRITYARGDQACDMSHLETMRARERGRRSAGLPLAYSEGRRPTPQISVAAPLPVGATSGCELADVYLSERVAPAEILSARGAGGGRGGGAGRGALGRGGARRHKRAPRRAVAPLGAPASDEAPALRPASPGRRPAAGGGGRGRAPPGDAAAGLPGAQRTRRPGGRGVGPGATPACPPPADVRGGNAPGRPGLPAPERAGRLTARGLLFGCVCSWSATAKRSPTGLGWPWAGTTPP